MRLKQKRAGLVQPIVRRVAILSLTALALAGAACGGSAPGAPASAPAATGPLDRDRPYASIDDAERDLLRAERELALVAGGTGARREAAPKAGSATGGAQPSQAVPAPPPAAAPFPPAVSQADDAVPKTEERARPAPTPCESACRALASMTHAADAICRLAGVGDARCASARRRVDDSAARVAECRCTP